MNNMIVYLVLKQVQVYMSFTIMKKHIQHISSHTCTINISCNTESSTMAVCTFRVHVALIPGLLRIHVHTIADTQLKDKVVTETKSLGG